MTLDTFNWITNICDRAYGFYYQVEFSCTKPNRYTIMDVDVMFVDDEYMNRCRIVKLSYVEPIDIKWNADNITWKGDTTFGFVDKSFGEKYFPNAAWDLKEAAKIFGCDNQWDSFNKTWNLNDIAKTFDTGTIETRKEKFMKSFYVGCGKKASIDNVIFNNPATIVFWSDGTKTVVKRQKGDKKFDPEKGLAMAICKKIMGNKGNFNDIFKEWIEEE